MNNTYSTTTTSEHNRSSKKFDLKAKINEIPDKLGFKIGEVAKYVGVKSYVLRYWETEFDSLNPKKSGNGQRFYTRKDIEMALTIRKLLYEDRFSIEGAKAALKKMKSMARSSQIVPEADVEITAETTESEILASHKPAAEIVFNKTKTHMIADKVAKQQELKQQLQPQNASSSHSPTQEALQKREKEITQFWVSSLDY
ncbi:MAG: MerR family transcriptional regulator, partial [Bdellovibrionaceae bacterium]|nr:MerR family transcriptional regulator [Pseudobdellovibrionaceae bacterium]